MSRTEPDANRTERELLIGWLDFHRDALADKCAGLNAEQMIAASVQPSNLTLLGLVRHLTEMERVYGNWALAGSGELQFLYGPYEDGGPEGDFDDLTVDLVEPSLATWRSERAATDAAIRAMPTLDAAGHGNGRSLRWNLVKLMQEYARHNGHADLLRESIDGATGE